MYKALLYKEWIKLKWVLLILLGISVFTYGKIFLGLGSAIEVKGAYHLWSVVVFKQSMVYRGVKYILPFAGIVIAVAQFFPETRRRRLRLLFHLPVDHNKSLCFMLFTGLACLFILILISLGFLLGMMSLYFPDEVVKSSIITSVPWFFSGIPAYLGVSLAIVEPASWRRVVYACAAFSMVQLLFMGSQINGYEHSFWKYFLLEAFYLFTILLPAFRFKRGLN